MKQVNWGMVAIIPVLLTGLFAAFVMFVGSVMGGGGCEGRPSPCHPDFKYMWAMLSFILFLTVLAAVGAYKIVNNLVRRHRTRKLSREEDRD
jgi:hypothetical protein